MDVDKWREVFKWACRDATEKLMLNPYPQLRWEIGRFVSWYRETHLSFINIIEIHSAAYALSRMSDDALRELHARWIVEREE